MKEILNKRNFKITGAIVFTLALFYGFYIFFQSHFLPGTFIGGKNMSFKSFAAAETILKKESENYLNSEISLSIDGKTKKVKLADLGVSIYPEKTVQIISEVKRFNYKTPLLTTISIKKMDTTLNNVFEITKNEAKNAKLVLGEKGEVIIQKEVFGKKIDEEKLKEEIKNRAKSLNLEPIVQKTIEDKPEILATELELKKEDILAKLDKKITIEDPIYKDDWQINLKEKIDWVVLEKRPFVDKNNNGKIASDIEILIDQTKLDAYLDENISKWLDIPASTVTINKDENGKILIDGKGNDGKKIDRNMLKESLEIAVDLGVNKVPVPLLTIDPEINVSEDLKALGIKERIGVGHTSYYGSPANRIHNIKVSAQRFNGVLIAPGEEFSFNTSLGQVDAKTGYKMELVIKKEGTIPEYGGGICQVSTTVYRSVLLSGLEITDRRSHSYAVSYYSQVLGDGLDATIYLGGQDFKFKNDTKHHILMQTYTDKDDKELYTVIYGTKDDRSVELEGPYISDRRGAPATIVEETTTLAPGERKQTDKPHSGFTAVWYRYLTKDGKTEVETIKSVYKAMPAKVLVGAGATPAAQ